MGSPSLAKMLSAQMKLANQAQEDVMNNFDLSIGNSVITFKNVKQAKWQQVRAKLKDWASMDLKTSAQNLQERFALL